MAGAEWIRVPVGDDAGRWATRGHTRKVLFIVHNVTSATRLLDVLPLFHDDFQVQLLVTCTGSSAFRAGVAGGARGNGGAGGALGTGDGNTGRLGRLRELRRSTPGTFRRIGRDVPRCRIHLRGWGHPTPNNTQHPTPGGEAAEVEVPVFGLSPEWLLDDSGRPVADALVLSHPEQMERLRAVCPEAAPTAVLAGDPCWDRMLAARPYRERYRRALGVGRAQRLVVLNSTWNPESLFGDGPASGDDVLPSLLPRLTSELPLDEYRLAAVLHTPTSGTATARASSAPGWTGPAAPDSPSSTRCTAGARHCSQPTRSSATTAR
ncbi:hypothetical protein ACRAWF_03735 [Streptomyces sp. L7]